MIEQKDFLQLFGAWGYTPPALRKIIKGIKDEAQGYDDRVGFIACINFEAMCSFAETDDPKRAFANVFSNVVSVQAIMGRAINEMGIDDNTIKAIEKTIKEGIREGSYSTENGIKLLEVYFDALKDIKSFEDALSYQRHKVMESLGKHIFITIANMAGEIGENIFEAMVKIALAYYEKENGMPIVAETNQAAAQMFDDMTKQILLLKDDILDLPSKIRPEFPELTHNIITTFYEDMPSNFDKLNFRIADVPSIMPHRLYDFKVAFCFIMSAFFLGINLGIFSYKNYDDIYRRTEKRKGLLDFEDINNIISKRSN